MSDSATLAYQQRYATAPSAALNWNATLSQILDHRSVRAFTPAEISPGEIETLVAAASSASTSSNIQAWSVIAVTDAALKSALAEIAGGQRHILEAPLILVWIADLSRANRVGQTAGAELLALDYTESFLVAAIDAALAAQNTLIAAQSLGLGGVFIGALRNDPLKVSELLDLPPHSFAVMGLVLGHPDPARPTAVKPRLPQSVVLHHNRYNTEAEAVGIAAHDEATYTFRIGQGLPPESWSALILKRLSGPKSMSGRHVLQSVLSRLGLARQ